MLFKREKASARASSDRFCPALPCPVLSPLKPNIPNNVKNTQKLWKTRANNRLWKCKQSAEFENLNNQLTLEM